MSLPISPLILIFVLGLLGLWLLLSSTKRIATDVILDLECQREIVFDNSEKSAKSINTAKIILGFDSLLKGDRQKQVLIKLLPIFFAMLLLAGSAILGLKTLSSSIVTLLVGVSFAYLFVQHYQRNKLRQIIKQAEFFLPIVMERIVMAAQSGLDVLASIQAVVEFDRLTESKQVATLASKNSDPVTMLLSQVYKLTENGRSLHESLNAAAAAVPCAAIKHAFIHLALAHKDGGELVMPLRELSESTQLYYQESVEEEIAKLPVKATVPLLCTFTGLIIFFLTAPIMQIMQITTTALPK